MGYLIVVEIGRKPMEENRINGSDFTQLSTDILKGGNSIRFKARGSSMLPWIKDGDKLTIQPITTNDICVGQVIIYPSIGMRPIVHRVIRIQSMDTHKIIVTRGDASPKSGEKIVAENVVRIHRNSKVIKLDQNLWWRLVRKFPAFLSVTYALVRFQRRLQRYVELSPKDPDHE